MNKEYFWSSEEFAVGWSLGGSALSGDSARNAPSSGQSTVSSGSWADFVSQICSQGEQCCPLVPGRSDGVKGGGVAPPLQML